MPKENQTIHVGGKEISVPESESLLAWWRQCSLFREILQAERDSFAGITNQKGVEEREADHARGAIWVLDGLLNLDPLISQEIKSLDIDDNLD